MTLNSAHLRAVGLTLYGPAWQAPLAEALGIAERSIRRWAAGKPVPAGVWPELSVICQEKEKALSEIIAYLETATLKGD